MAGQVRRAGRSGSAAARAARASRRGGVYFGSLLFCLYRGRWLGTRVVPGLAVEAAFLMQLDTVGPFMLLPGLLVGAGLSQLKSKPRLPSSTPSYSHAGRPSVQDGDGTAITDLERHLVTDEHYPGSNSCEYFCRFWLLAYGLRSHRGGFFERTNVLHRRVVLDRPPTLRHQLLRPPEEAVFRRPDRTLNAVLPLPE